MQNEAPLNNLTQKNMGNDKTNFNVEGSKGLGRPKLKGVDALTPEEIAKVEAILQDTKKAGVVLTREEELVLRARLGAGVEEDAVLLNQTEGASEEIRIRIALMEKAIMDAIKAGKASADSSTDTIN